MLDFVTELIVAATLLDATLRLFLANIVPQHENTEARAAIRKQGIDQCFNLTTRGYIAALKNLNPKFSNRQNTNITNVKCYVFLSLCTNNGYVQRPCV